MVLVSCYQECLTAANSSHFGFDYEKPTVNNFNTIICVDNVKKIIIRRLVFMNVILYSMWVFLSPLTNWSSNLFHSLCLVHFHCTAEIAAYVPMFSERHLFSFYSLSSMLHSIFPFLVPTANANKKNKINKYFATLLALFQVFMFWRRI